MEEFRTLNLEVNGRCGKIKPIWSSTRNAMSLLGLRIFE